MTTKKELDKYVPEHCKQCKEYNIIYEGDVFVECRLSGDIVSENKMHCIKIYNLAKLYNLDIRCCFCPHLEIQNFGDSYAVDLLCEIHNCEFYTEYLKGISNEEKNNN
jgi:hypothetical protein